METTNASEGRLIKIEDLATEISSWKETLGLLHTVRGPNCEGCYNVVFSTTCGHAYVFRKRCHPMGLVCAGSEILTVPVDSNIVLDLGRADGATCLRMHTDSKSRKKKQPNARRLTPKLMAATMRAEAIKELWQRKCIELGNLPAHGPRRRQLYALAEELERHRSSQRSQEEPQVSPSNSSGNPDDRPRMLHDPNLDREWMERAGLILQNLRSISRADKDPNSPQSPIDDPSPAFVFHSPFLRETFDQGLEEVDTTATQPASETESY